MGGSLRGLLGRGPSRAKHPTGTEPRQLLSASAQPVAAAVPQSPAALEEGQVGVTVGNPPI